MTERSIRDPLLKRLGEVVNMKTNPKPDDAQQWDVRAQQLLGELEEHLFSDSADGRKIRISRAHRIAHPRYAAVGTLVVVIAIVAFIISDGTSPSVSSAAAFLSTAAKAALTQSNVPSIAPGQYYYEPTIENEYEGCQEYTTPAGLIETAGADGTGPVFVYVSQLERDEWSADNDGGAIQTTFLGGHFATAADIAAWKSEGSPNLSGCEAPAPSGNIPPPTSGGGGVGFLPTSAASLGALLAEGRINDVGQVSATDQYCPTTSQSEPSDGDACSVATQFDIASNLLGQPEGPSLVGPALYEILAQLPGVEEVGSVTNAYGQTGTAIEDPTSGDVFVIDPTSGQLLEQEQIATASTAGGAFPVGTVRFSVSYGPLSVVNSLGVRPTGGAQNSN